MSSDTTMSREEKEALLNARMEQIRKKNSELQKRYEEVQKDKQNAEAVSNTFQESRRVAPPREIITRPKPARQHERQQQRTLPSYPKRTETQKTTESPTKITTKPRSQRLKDDDGPPPDPSYRFLADKSREREEETKKEDGEQQHDRNQGSRRHPGNYGGRDFDNVKVSIEKRRSYEKMSPRHPPRNKMEMTLRMTGRERREYENWRSERNRIEEDRMNRQRTSSGEWRREWDREKDQEKDGQNKDDGLQWRSRGRGEVRDGSRLIGRGGGGGSQPEFVSMRDGRSGQSNWRSQDNDTRHDGSSFEITEHDKPSHTVQFNGNESINVSFSNDVTPQEDKQRSFSRDSFSSQSEDEWRRGDWHQQSETYFQTDKSDSSDVVFPRRSVTLFNEEVKGAEANAQQPSLKVVVNQESDKREVNEENSNKQESDEGWEDDGGGSWEDCTTSGNESLVLSEHSQDEFSDCHLEGNAAEHDVETQLYTSMLDANTSSQFPDEINREDEPPVTYSSFDVNDYRGSRETTPIVVQSKAPIEVEKHSRETTPIVEQPKVSEAPIEVENQEVLDTTQQVDGSTRGVTDVTFTEILPAKDEESTDSKVERPIPDAATMASPESIANDVSTKITDSSVVHKTKEEPTATVNEEGTEETNEVEIETKEGENHERAQTPKNLE